MKHFSLCNRASFILILPILFLGLSFSYGQGDAAQVKEWRASHPEVKPISKEQFQRLSEYGQLRAYGNENILFYEGELQMADIEVFSAGERPEFVQHLAQPYEKWRVTQWIDEHEDEISIWSRADFEQLTEDEQATLLNQNAFIYEGDFPTLAEIKAYEEG
ncbi:MAG: hypothetical protein AAF740_04310 [Bacteroidota bacterium]